MLTLSGCKGCNRAAPVATEGPADAAVAQSAKRAPAPSRPPLVVAKTPSIAPDLSNVAVSVLLTKEQRARIGQNGFTVSPGNTKEFYEVYERARYDYVPIFVTSDSLLHVYHLIFDRLLRGLEATQWSKTLAELDGALLDASLAQAEQLKGTPLEDAAKKNAAYFAVAVKLLRSDFVIPEALRPLVEADLAAIEKHEGPAKSAIFPGYPEGEDWSQYVPRGHYVKTPELQAYFKAMMWHGRMTFRASDVDETKRAALLLVAFERAQVNGRPAREAWEKIYEPTVFFVGRSDDLTPSEYTPALRTAWGQIEDLKVVDDAAKVERFQAAIAELRAPEVLGMVISQDEPDVERATKGLRFMGQRTVPDSVVFRALVDRNVPNRMLPKALDLFAALGSARALEHLDAMGETKIDGYSPALTKVQRWLGGLDEETFTQNLYWSWIHTLRPLLAPVPDTYPQFMRSPAWLDKQLQTALASWTELKHDTLLYTKPVYAEMGGGGLPPPEPEPPKGYVEPVPELFTRIAALAEQTKDGLSTRGLLGDAEKFLLDEMITLATKLRTIAEKQLTGATPTPEEYELIRFYGGKIEELTFSSSDEITPGSGGIPEGGDELQAAIVADIATDPNGQVLEQATGRVFELYAAVPIEGRLVLAKGAVFSHYEFTVPIAQRLTDEAWRARLDAGDVPPRAEWTKSFIVDEVVSQELAQRIMSFTEAWVSAIWYSDEKSPELYLEGKALAEATSTITEQEKKREYVGKKRLLVEFLSFDFQDATHATVTARETWQDELNRGDPVEEELEKLGERGPYTIEVTYSLVKRDPPKGETPFGDQGAAWKITTIVKRPSEPAWKMVK
ncbi:DUF3160 domain-containing protein [Myxococcota bacterium]|nr:DUF3160 domain-containing protein [Myxococcota bacterium]